MNVAITRAKRHIFIIGNKQTLVEGDKDIENFVRHFTNSSGCRTMWYTDFLEKICSVRWYSDTIKMYLKFTDSKLKELGITDHEYNSAENCLVMKPKSEKEANNSNSGWGNGEWGEKDDYEFQDIEFNIRDEPTFSRPHSHSLSDRINKSQLDRHRNFDLHIKSKYSEKLKKYDVEGDDKKSEKEKQEEAYDWKLKHFMESSNMIKPEEYEDEEEEEVYETEMFSDAMFENKNSTNIQNKFAAITNDSSSDTTSESSGNTYVSSIISDF